MGQTIASVISSIRFCAVLLITYKIIFQSDHTYKVSQRNHVQPSKKKGCPAKIKIRHVLKFPGYQVCIKLNLLYNITNLSQCKI